jgi:hypothetical protein
MAASRSERRRAEAIALYGQGLEVEGYDPRLALEFYRRADRKNTKVCVDVFLVAFLAPMVAAVIVEWAFRVVRPFWEGVLFAVVGMLPAITLAYLRGFGEARETGRRSLGIAALVTFFLVFSDLATLALMLLSIIIGMLVVLLPISLGFSLFAGMPFFRLDLLPLTVSRPVFWIVFYLSLVMWFTNVPLTPPYDMRRLVVGGLAGLLAAWDELLGLAARFGLVALAVAVPRFDRVELLVSSGIAGLLMAIALHRIEIDKDLPNLTALGKLRALFRLGRRWRIYHVLTTLIEDTKDDQVGVKQLVWALAHPRVLYAWQISPPPDESPGCIGGLIWSALNYGLTMLPYFEESPQELLAQANAEGRRPPALRQVWDLTVARSREVVTDAMRKRLTRELLAGSPIRQL